MSIPRKKGKKKNVLKDFWVSLPPLPVPMLHNGKRKLEL